MQLTEELFMNSRQSGSVRKLVRLGGIGILSAVAFAQTTPVVLDIAIENAVQYVADVTDPSKLALSASATTAASTRAFTDTIFVGDIVSINGKPAKGMWTSRQYKMGFSPSPAAGLAISDATQGTIAECKWEIQNANGQFIGRLMDGGLFPHAVSGGTGAFIGAKGEMGTGTPPVVKAVRIASMTEDPASRRTLGGGNVRVLMRLIPYTHPEVVNTPNGPAVTHADGKPVTAANPAQAGETLTLYAWDLGPTTPAVDFGQPFPQGSAYAVNAPVEVLVNGQSAEVLGAVGYAGAVDGYQVNFRFPAGIAAGTASLNLTAAWVPGSAVTIATK
jgi:hypothetical protein